MKPAENRRLRCPRCESEFVYRTPPLQFILIWIIVGAAVGIAKNLLFGALAIPRDIWWGWLVWGAVMGILATLISRRFRRLSKNRAVTQ